MTLRICITGPEATGKSSLAKTLAEHFACSWVPEYARFYLAKLGRPYRREDLDEILAGQVSLEASEASIAKGPFLFCDTGPEVVWVWSEYKYREVSLEIDKATQKREYKLTLLMDVDLPWTPDPLRENPSPTERAEIFDHYRTLLDRTGRSYKIISGFGEIRKFNALSAIDEMT